MYKKFSSKFKRNLERSVNQKALIGFYKRIVDKAIRLDAIIRNSDTFKQYSRYERQEYFSDAIVLSDRSIRKRIGKVFRAKARVNAERGLKRRRFSLSFQVRRSIITRCIRRCSITCIIRASAWPEVFIRALRHRRRPPSTRTRIRIPILIT